MKCEFFENKGVLDEEKKIGKRLYVDEVMDVDEGK